MSKSTSGPSGLGLLLISLSQIFFLCSPLLNMFWRGVAFKGFNIVRAVTRIVKMGLLAICSHGGEANSQRADDEETAEEDEKKGGKKKTPKDNKRKQKESKDVTDAKKEGSLPKGLVPIFAFLDKIELLCIHARGLMQVLAGYVRYQTLVEVGAPVTFLFVCDVEYHTIFAIVYIVTMLLSEKTLGKRLYGKIVIVVGFVFKYSDLVKNAAWCHHFFNEYTRALIGRDMAKATLEVSAAEAEAALLQFQMGKAALGVVVTCLDMYSGYFGADTIRPLTLSCIQIISAVFYIWVSFL